MSSGGRPCLVRVSSGTVRDILKPDEPRLAMSVSTPGQSGTNLYLHQGPSGLNRGGPALSGGYPGVIRGYTLARPAKKMQNRPGLSEAVRGTGPWVIRLMPRSHGAPG